MSRSTTRHGVSGEWSDRKRAILLFMPRATFENAAERRRSATGPDFLCRPAEGASPTQIGDATDAWRARPNGRAAAARQLKLLGSEARPPRPRRRVPRNAASREGATALIGIATISTSLSGPAATSTARWPDCQKGRVTSLHN